MGKIVLIRFSTKQTATPLTRPANFPRQLAALMLGEAKKYLPRLQSEPNKSNQLWCDAMILTNDLDLVASEARNLYSSG